jgi:uncharacterized RDD family membrane protein YckC
MEDNMSVAESAVDKEDHPGLNSAIGSLWRRLVAYLADSVIIGLPCMIIAIPFFDWLSKIGYLAKLIGFFIGLIYFTIFDSTIKNGQSPGRRWRNLRVVDKSGNPLSPEKAIIRYSIYALPIYLNGMQIPGATSPIALALIGLIIFGVGGVSLYLLIFNRHTRQGLHDLAVGSFVVKSDHFGPVEHQPIWRKHWLTIGIYLCLLVSGAGYMTYKMPKTQIFPAMMADIRLIEGMEGVSGAGIQNLVRSQMGSSKSQNVLVVNVEMWKKPEDAEKFASHIANTLLDHDPAAKNHDLILVMLNRGYNLGVTSWHYTQGFEHTPNEWGTLNLDVPSKKPM